MRSIISLFTLFCAACGAPGDLVESESQALSPAERPAIALRCERGAGLPALQARAVDHLPVARLDLARKVRTPQIEAAPDFLPSRLELSGVSVSQLNDGLYLEARGLDPFNLDAEGYGVVILSTTDGSRDLASVEPFGRCGTFWLSTQVPVEGAVPDTLRVEWRHPSGRSVSAVVEVW